MADDLETIAVEETREDAIKAAVAVALLQASTEDEPVTINACLSDSGDGLCPTRTPGGHGCALCRKIVVDQFGHVTDQERPQ
jgi:hypothetical protein